MMGYVIKNIKTGDYIKTARKRRRWNFPQIYPTRQSANKAIPQRIRRNVWRGETKENYLLRKAEWVILAVTIEEVTSNE